MRRPGWGWMLAAAVVVAPFGAAGELRVEIHTPAAGRVLPTVQTSIEVTGGTSAFGGARTLDLFLVLDTSRSLRRTDPEDFRSVGAIGLVRTLSATDTQIGVVDLDKRAILLSPLTSDREAVVAVLQKLDRSGGTDLAAGIRAALAGFESNGRPDSSRVLLVFTDGRTRGDDTRRAMEEARGRGVAIHTVALGTDRENREVLAEVAAVTGGSFVGVTDPSELPEAFANLRFTGVERVTLHANDSEPIDATMTGGQFTGWVPLQPGRNWIVATARSLAGETREQAVEVHVPAIAIETPGDGAVMTGGPKESEVAEAEVAPVDGSPAESIDPLTAPPSGCGELAVVAESDGKPTVGTPFRVLRGEVPVALGALGAQRRLRLPVGNYRVQVDSTPPVVLEIAIASGESATLQLKRERDRLYHRVQRRPASESIPCQAGVGSESAGAAAPAAWVSRP
ncbi:MAG: vWA domain-containing protein [Myxococcota bacterium]